MIQLPPPAGGLTSDGTPIYLESQIRGLVKGYLLAVEGNLQAIVDDGVSDDWQTRDSVRNVINAIEEIIK